MTKNDLKAIAASLNPAHFLSAPEYLAALYQAVKAAADKYSYIQFTEDLGLGHCNALYLIIHGQRPLTKKAGQKIATALDLRGVSRQYFLKLVETKARGTASERDETLDDLMALKARTLPTDLDREQLEFYQQWYHAAILELLSLPGCSDDPVWLGQHLQPNVPPQKVKASLSLLQRLRHVAFDKKQGRLIPTQTTLTTGNEVYGVAVLRYHHQMISLARDALTDVVPTERDISAVTIGIPASAFDQVKAEIQSLRQRLLALSAAQSDSDQIIQVNIQMFPLGRLNLRSKRNED